MVARSPKITRLLVAAVVLSLLAPFIALAADPITIASPDSQIKVTVQPDSSGRLSYSFAFKGQPVIDAAGLGITIDNKDLGAVAVTGAPKLRDFEETNKVPGNHAPRSNPGHEALIPVTGGPDKTP